MRPYYAGLLCLAAALLAGSANAQMTCGNNEPAHLVPLHHNDPAKLAQMEADELALEQFTQNFQADDRGGNNYVIPVVFHIIHNNGPENISDEQVEDAVRVLNDDYNKLNLDWPNVNPAFLNLVADVGISFRLAQKDPQGNCTKGITRTQSVLTYDGTQDMKDLIQWPRDKYLNVWVAASADGAAGYTQTPGSVSQSWAAPADGIVVLHNYIGSIGTSSPSHSRVLTHEVGHWINLKHTWGGTNEPALASNCGSDDNVSDTPNTIGWTYCNVNGATCSSLDNVENYMEYSYCCKMFTEGQKTRMLAALNSSTADRSDLWQLSNLVATGTDGPDILCAADFSSDKRTLCAGQSVQFSDASYHGATSWNWSFPGGTPATSTDEDPLVSYSVPGLYTVSLVAGNGLGSVSTTQNNYVMVLSSTGVPAPFAEGFEAATAIPNNDWFVSNPNGAGTFELNGTAAYSGSKSVRLNNYGNDVGTLNELVSTSIDLSQAPALTLSFRHAFARRSSADGDDLLRVYVSNDCGANWSLRKQLRATTNLPTVANQNSPFTPSSQADWAYTEITNITSSYFVADFRVKFWFESQGGNNFWLDDININGGPVGIFGPGADQTGMVVVPNPVVDNADVVFDLPSAGQIRLDLLDALGREIAIVHEGMSAAGEQRFALPVEGLESGLYLVRLVQDGNARIVRFTRP